MSATRFRLFPTAILFATLLLAACAGRTEQSGTDTSPPAAPATSTGSSESAAPTSAPAVPGGNVGRERLSDPYGPPTEAALVAFAGDRVYFAFDSAELSPEARTTLEKQADWLRHHPEVRVVIEGHTDERGTREYNLALGERRANAVKNYLIALGIAPDRLDTVSYGKERPAVLGTGEEVWRLNRRAVLRIREAGV